jgi:hypothetical protein
VGLSGHMDIATADAANETQVAASGRWHLGYDEIIYHENGRNQCVPGKRSNRHASWTFLETAFQQGSYDEEAFDFFGAGWLGAGWLRAASHTFNPRAFFFGLHLFRI